MFFNIDKDDGHAISGWIAPDNPSAVPHIVIVIPGRNEITIDADLPRTDIRELGIHKTGHVGFLVDEKIVPDLGALAEIELLESESRLPIFRRFIPEQHIRRRAFLFDGSVMPQRRILQNISQHFSLVYPAAERFPLETMIVLINNHSCDSIVFSGRSNFNRYVTFLETNQYFRAALLRDPFEELAERLLFLSLLAKPDWAPLAPLYATGLTPLIEFARDLPFNDPKGLLAAFRALTDEQRAAIQSPMVRMLGCTLEDVPTHHHVSLALDHLASLDLVGTRSRYPAFRAMLTQILGTDILGPEVPASFQTVEVLARSLSRIGIVADLLEHDVTLYGLAHEAVVAGLEGHDELADRDTQTI